MSGGVPVTLISKVKHMTKKFWKLENFVEGSESGSRLYIDGVISEDSWWGDEATPQQLRDELKNVKGDTLEVVINSPGGDVWAGVAMHDALKELNAEVTVKVSGVAASIASIIAMAGDKIVMTPGSTMMIHKASMFAWGNTEDMAKAIELLQACEEGLVSIYADRTGKTKEAIEAMMSAETWMSAEKAVELGFADSVVKPEKVDDDEPANLFAGNFAFSMKATEKSLKDFASKVAAHEAKEPSSEQIDEAKDDNPKPEPAAQAPAKKPTATVDAEKDEPAPKVTTNSSKKDPSIMTNPQDDAAATQVINPDDQAPVTAVPSATAYLKSKKSVEDFAEVLRATAGKSTEEVRAAWKRKLVENNLTDPDYFTLPEPVITSIETAVKASGIYNVLNHTGLDIYKAVWDDADEDADTSRAGGHNKGDTKDEQILDFDDRVLRAKYIYKYLTLDKETIRENKSTGALVRFVLSELPERVIREIERAVVIGDGRSGGNKRHITSFLSVKADVVADNVFATEYVPEVDETLYETLIRAKALIEAEGAVYLVSKKGFVTDLLLQKNVNDGFVFQPGTDVVKALGFAGGFEPTWFKDANDADYDAYLVVFSAYKTVGDSSIESFTNFKLETNENEFLQEIYKGGGLTQRISAVGIAASDES